MPIIGTTFVLFLLYVFVWRALPCWLQASLQAACLVLSLAVLLLLYRCGFLSVFGQALLDIGMTFLQLAKYVVILIVYAFTGYCPDAKCV